jgi:uncharacterized metal-binding protein
MKYCLNCKQNVEPNKSTGAWIIGTIVMMITLGVLIPIIGGIIVLIAMVILYQFADKKCPICHGNNFRKESKK